MSDWELIEQYAKTGSETAFSELVQRHLAWVYSVALRQVGRPELAEEIAQSVFLLLARKAGSLSRRVILSGWLFRTTRFVASRALRAEIRRLQRHQTFSTMTAAADEPDVAWEQLAPYLEQAVAALSKSDRAAILLRFYEKKPLLEVGQSLGITEEAAKKRVSRAVDKLRTFLARRGVTLAAAGLISALAAKTVQAAPASLAPGIIATTGKSALAITPRLVQETLRAWRWAKIKLAAGITVGSVALVLLVGISSGFFTHHNAVPTTPAIAATPAAPSAQSPPIAAAPKAALSSPKKTDAITGVVLDDEGKPIWGASVWGGFSFKPFARDTTDQSGQFALDKSGDPNVVTVSVDGFATDQQEFNATNASAPLAFKLSRIPPLVVRIVDESGHGVAGVELSLFHWWGRVSTLAQYLPQKTDAEGRLKWTSPPKGELEVEFAPLGYRASRTNKFTADGIEHTVVLHPAVHVRGSVTDAETGDPISAFKITQGQGFPVPVGETYFLWDLRTRTSSNGVYRVTIDEEQKPYLRLEADGYETLEAEIHLTNATEVTCDFKLKRVSPAGSIRGIVLGPDGSPAAGVEVALCTRETGVKVRGTAFEPGIFGNRIPSPGDFRRTTDPQGSFSFAPKPGAHTVIAVSPAGIGQAHCFNVSQPQEIRLQPWGRIEGTVRTRDGNWGGQVVHWDAPGRLTSWMNVYYDPGAFSARTDDAGAFTLEHIPPGFCRVSADAAISTSIEVIAGQTAHVQVGGLGRAVMGKLIAPADTPIRDWTNQVTFSMLHTRTASYDLPDDLKGSDAERWKLEFEDTPAGRDWLRGQFSYPFKVGADGSFRIPEVLPGKYDLMVFVAQGNLGSAPDNRRRYSNDPQIAQIRFDVTVPEDSAGNGPPVDLGEIVLLAQH